MHPMRVILQSVLCGAKVATLGAHVACSCSVLGLNVVVQVGRLGHQVAHRRALVMRSRNKQAVLLLASDGKE